MWIILSILSLLFITALSQVLLELKEASKLELLLKELHKEEMTPLSHQAEPERIGSLLQSLNSQTQLLEQILEEGRV